MSETTGSKKNFSFVIIGLVCIVAGLYLGLEGIAAIKADTNIHFSVGSKPRPMTGGEAVIGAFIALLIGCYGIRLGLKGER